MIRSILCQLTVLSVTLSLICPALSQESSPISIRATALTEEFAKDEKATTKKYGNQNMIVTGIIVKTAASTKSSAGEVWLTGHNEKDKNPIRVRCFFPSTQDEKVKKLKVGATVTIQGIFYPFNSSLAEGTVSLRTCAVED